MKILLLNKNPIISKLVRLSAEKLEYEFEEQTQYAQSLPKYDVIIIDDSVDADLQDLQSKCERLICISSGETNTQETRKILHKPFLPTDLIALMKDSEQNNSQEAPQEQSQQESTISHEASLDLDSLSFDNDANENQENPENQDENNIYLQDIKEEENLNADKELNLDGFNLDSTSENNDLPDLNNENPVQNENVNFDETDQDLSENLNLASPQNDNEALENELSMQDEQENLAVNEENSLQNEQIETPQNDETSLEPIDFVQIPLPSLDTQESQKNEEEVESSQQETKDENEIGKTNNSQELEFDSKDIADIMGLDEQNNTHTIDNNDEIINSSNENLIQEENLNLNENPVQNENVNFDETEQDLSENLNLASPQNDNEALENELSTQDEQENLAVNEENSLQNEELENLPLNEAKNPNQEEMAQDEQENLLEENTQNEVVIEEEKQVSVSSQSEATQEQVIPNENDVNKQTLDLNLENADFLQPLNEKPPFSLEEKEEHTMSFDDLPENAQFLGQDNEEIIEADEIRPILVDEPKIQSTQDMVKEQLAALNAMDSEESTAEITKESLKEGSSEIFSDLQGLSERELQIALGEIAQEPKKEEVENITPSKVQQSTDNSQNKELIDELSRGISGAITSSIKDEALKAALKGMNMHIDINIKFDEEKA